MSPFVDVVFDGPPSARSGRFIECEDEHGCGTKAGGWIDRGDGTWALRIQLPSGVPEAHNAVRDALSTLVRLYHGPRDANYRTNKDEAWDAAERALEGTARASQHRLERVLTIWRGMRATKRHRNGLSCAPVLSAALDQLAEPAPDFDPAER